MIILRGFTGMGTLLFILTCIACNGLSESKDHRHDAAESSPDTNTEQIAEYIRHIFQDKNGDLWLGTGGYGVAIYHGDSLTYYSNPQGFVGQQITGISEDPQKNIWFATDQGIVKYAWRTKLDGSRQFSNFPGDQYFQGERFWSVFADSKGNVWAGAASGIYRFDGLNWTPFALPYPEKANGEFITKSTAWSIYEDQSGILWFSTNGYGAFAYDPVTTTFTHYTVEDGLADNSVDHILQDRQGNMWLGTRFGGVSRFDGESFINYTQKDSIGNNEVCAIYEDSKGNIWLSSEGYGVYRYTPSSSHRNESFTNYSEAQGLGVRTVQTILEDDQGRIWVGGGGGLYRLEGESFIHVTASGPWE